MIPFSYERAADVGDARRAWRAPRRQISRRRHQSRRSHARDDRAARVAGGRDWAVRARSRRPTTAACGSAPASKNTAVAADRRVRERYPLLAQAILAGASAQIRNMATVGGNLMQRTRCLYFYDDAARCNKRAARQRLRRASTASTAITPSSARRRRAWPHNPSDMCVALAALDATVTVKGKNGARDIL